MARVELPQSKLKVRKRRRLVRMVWRIPLALAVVVIIAGGLLAWGSHAPFLKITTIAVSGEQTLSSSTLQQFTGQEMMGSYLFLFAKNNIFIYPRAKIAQDLLNSYPQLKSVDVHAANFHTVAVNVVEREPVALWCPSVDSGQASTTAGESLASSTAAALSEPTGLPPYGSCYLMDQDGVVYQPSGDASTSQYVIYQNQAANASLPMQFLTADQFHSLSALVDALSQKMGTTTVTQVSVDGSGDVQAQFNDGFILEFLLADAGGDVFENFNLALQSDVFKSNSLDDFQYLDLRFGQKLYYLLKQ